MLFDPARRVLTGHIARANGHPARCGDGDALAIFQGPNAYVSPNWYPSKAAHGKAVPTWNYEAVHVEGTLCWQSDGAWLRDHLRALSDRFERDEPTPWSLDDAPADFLERLMGLIVGLEVHVRSVRIKRKLSQNRAEADRQGVIAALVEGDDAAGREVARLMIAAQAHGSG